MQTLLIKKIHLTDFKGANNKLKQLQRASQWALEFQVGRTRKKKIIRLCHTITDLCQSQHHYKALVKRSIFPGKVFWW